MSRYNIAARKTHPLSSSLNIAIGWDNPLQSFFATVIQIPENDDEDEKFLLDVGGMPQEITTVEELKTCLAPWADLTSQITSRLESDHDKRTNPTPLQAFGVKLSESMLKAMKNPEQNQDIVMSGEIQSKEIDQEILKKFQSPSSVTFVHPDVSTAAEMLNHICDSAASQPQNTGLKNVEMTTITIKNKN